MTRHQVFEALCVIADMLETRGDAQPILDVVDRLIDNIVDSKIEESDPPLTFRDLERKLCDDTSS